MACYEYECRECGHRMTALSFKNDSDAAKPGQCEECETWASMDLAVCPSGFKLCGAGFHTNDYPKTSKLGAAKKSFAVGAPEGGKK